MGAAARVLALLFVLAGVAFAVAAPGLARTEFAPSGEWSNAECYQHHRQDGFRSMDLFPDRIEMAPQGQAFPLRLTIRNPWLHELQDVAAFVNLSGAPGVRFPGDKEPYLPPPEEGVFDASPVAWSNRTFRVPVDANATELLLVLDGDVGNAPAPLQGLGNDFSLFLASPDGARVRVAANDSEAMDVRQAPRTREEIRLASADLFAGGPGDWIATVSFKGPEAAAFSLDVAVHYNLSRATERVLPVADVLRPGEDATVEFTLLADDSDAVQLVRYGGLGHAYYDHSDASTRNDHGDYRKWDGLSFPLGAELRRQGAVVEDADIDTLSPIFRRWGEVLGFAGSFLLIPSLVLGGTFGKGSVNLFNKVFGSPRRRVLFHNSVSFWLLGVSILHLVLLLYETQWGWSHGLVWGGLALACMIGLGVTGATQRAFVARWGFTRWRFVHFAMGILVAVFILVHVLADGAHLAPVREALFGGGGE